MDQEIKILKEKLADMMLWERVSALFVSDSLGRHEVVVVRSGIGKMISIVTTTLLIHQCGVSMVINTGSAGNIDEELKAGDLVVTDKLAYFDVDVTNFDYAYERLSDDVSLYFRASKYLRMETAKAAEKTGLAIRKGLIVTGDIFVDSTKRIAEIKKEFPETLACEMEDAVTGQAASQFSIPFLVARAMGDTADGEAAQSFDEFINETGRRSAGVAIHFVENLV